MPVFSISFDASGVKSGSKDAASALKVITTETERAEQSVKKLGVSYGTMFKGAMAITAPLLVAGAAMGVVDTLSQMIKQGIDYNKQLEESRIGIASIVASTTDVIDSQNKILQGEEKFIAAQKISVEMAKALDAASVKTAASYTDLLAAYQTVLAPATQMGLTWEQTLDTVITMSNALGALNVPTQRLAVEMQRLMSGTNINKSVVAMRMGLTKEEIESWGKGEQFFNKLNERLEQMKLSGDAVQNTFKAISVFYDDVMDSVSAETGRNLFESMKVSMTTIAETIYTMDKKTGFFKINDEIKGLTTLLGDAQTAIGEWVEATARATSEGLVGLSSFLDKYRETIGNVVGAIPEVVMGLGTWTLAMKVFQRNAVVGFAGVVVAARAAQAATIGAAATTGAILRIAGAGFLGFFGGPVGVAILGVSAAIAYLTLKESEFDKVNRLCGEGLQRTLKEWKATGEAAGETSEAIGKASEAIEKKRKAEITSAIDDFKKQISTLSTAGSLIGSDFMMDFGLDGPFAEATQKFEDGKIEAREFAEEISRIGKETGLEAVAEKIITYAAAINVQMKKLEDLGEKATEKYKVVGNRTVENIEMSAESAKKVLEDIDKAYNQLIMTDAQLNEFNLNKELDRFYLAAEHAGEAFDEIESKIQRLKASTEGGNYGSVNDMLKDRKAVSEELRKLELGEKQYAEIMRKERIARIIDSINQEKLEIKAQITAQAAKLQTLKEFNLQEIALITSRIAASTASVAELDALIGKITAHQGKLFAGSGGGSSAASALKSVTDELAKITMSEREYAEFKLDQKYKDLQKEIGKTSPELQKLIELERTALGGNFSSADDMMKKLREAKKLLDNSGKSEQDVRMEEARKEIEGYRTAIEGLQKQGIPSPISENDLANLEKLIETTAKYGLKVTDVSQTLQNFEKEYQQAFGGTGQELKSINNEMEMYKAAVDSSNLSLERRSEILVRVEALAGRKRLEASTDFFDGAKRGFQKYTEDAGNAAKAAEQFVTNSFSSMEDAMVQFVQTGKMDFKSLADSIIADLMRISVRMAMFGDGKDGGFGGIIGGLVGLIPKLFTGGGGISFSGSILDFGGSYTAALANLGAAHGGGVAGVQYTFQRSVEPSALIGASRYHGGGIAGLYPGEVPAILQKGEPVFTQAQAATLAPVSQIAQAIREALRGTGPSGVGTSAVTVNIQNYSKAEVEEKKSQDGQGNWSMDLIIRDVEKGIAKNIAAGNSPVAGAMARSYQLSREGALYSK
jgi:lambda family phage tail tape measure protein